jgi:hypothetical protein
MFTARRTAGIAALVAAAVLSGPTLAQAPAKAAVDAGMKAAFDKYKTLKEGANAD